MRDCRKRPIPKTHLPRRSDLVKFLRAVDGSREPRRADRLPTPALADAEISPHKPGSATDWLMTPSRVQLANSYGLGLDLRFDDQKQPDRQYVHTSALETVDRFLRCTNDWFILIEAGIENDRNTRLPMEGSNQIVVHRIFFASHGLQAASVVDVIHRAQLFAFFRTDFVDMQHERRWMIVLEIFVLVVSKDRRRERTEPLPVFDASV